MTQGYIRFPVDRLIPRPIRPDEVPHVRRVWWRQAALGYRLPAESGLILLDGGRH